MVRRLRQKLFVKLARISAGRIVAASDFKPSHSPKVHRKERIIPTSVGDSRVIVYEPFHRSADPLPVFVNFHGSGFVMGNAEMDDPWCRSLANVPIASSLMSTIAWLRSINSLSRYRKAMM